MSDVLRRIPLLQLVLCLALAGLLPAALLAQDGPCVPRGHHPWGRFQPDSWKRVRVVSETLDASGAIVSRSITDTITTLDMVDEDGFDVNVDVVVDVEGKQFESPKQTVRHGYCGQQNGQQAMFRKVGETVLMIAGQSISCEKREINIADGPKTRTVTIFYSATVSPFVLRRESSTSDGEGVASSSVTEVVSLNEEQEILGEVVKTAKLKTTFTQGKATRVTVETVSDSVPGGVIKHTSQETDDQGRVVRRSTLELLGYEAVDEPDEKGRPARRRLFGRRNRDDRREDRRSEEMSSRTQLR